MMRPGYIIHVFLVATLVTMSSGCAGFARVHPNEYNKSTSKETITLSSPAEFVVPARIGIFKYHFGLPAGTYVATLEDTKGTYFESQDGYFWQDNTNRHERGGIYKRKDGSGYWLHLWPVSPGANPALGEMQIVAFGALGSGKVPVPYVFIPAGVSDKFR